MPDEEGYNFTVWTVLFFIERITPFPTIILSANSTTRTSKQLALSESSGTGQIANRALSALKI